VGYPSDRVGIGSPEGQTRQTHPKLRAAVQAVLKREEFIPAGVQRGQQRRSFVRFAAAATKERPAQVPRQDAGEPFGEIHNRLGQINRSGVLQRPNLPAYRLDNLRMAVAKRVNAHAGVKVHVPLARRIVQVYPLPAHDLRWIFVEMVRARDKIALFLCPYSLWPYKFTFGQAFSPYS
jgi:hypothetical protein